MPSEEQNSKQMTVFHSDRHGLSEHLLRFDCESAETALQKRAGGEVEGSVR